MARFVSVGKETDFQDGKITTVTVNNHDIALARVKGKFFALDNTCPHRAGQIGDGTIFGTNVTCPVHFWSFDLRSGATEQSPTKRLPTYEVRVAGKEVQINADQVPPDTPKMGYLEKWARKNDPLEPTMDFIHNLSKGIQKDVSPMGTKKKVPGFENILFKPAQLARLPLLDNEEVDSTTVIGKKAKRPLELAMPILVSHMSFGSLSKEAKIAIAKGTAAVGTAMGSGEGGMLPEAQKQAKHYIFEMATGYFGWNKENIKKASAIEIKIGQSAKPGLGGLLPANKVTEEIAQVRGVKKGTAVQSPSRFRDINSKQDLRKRVTWIKEVNGGKPVGIKFAAGNIEKDIDVALYAGADYITIDGRGGGTGAAETFIKDHFAVPLLYALRRARRHLDKKKSTVSLLVTGRLRTPDDFLKCLAMGADAVYVATAAMMAIGCQQYRACNNDSCPVGITTHKQHLRDRLSIDQSAKQLENFLKGSNEIMKKMCMAMGRKRMSDVDATDIFTIDSEIARHTDIEHAGF